MIADKPYMFRLLAALLKRLLPQCEKLIDDGHSRAARREEWYYPTNPKN